MLASHPNIRILIAAVLLVGASGLMLVVRNRLIRRRLLFSAGVAAGAALLHLVAAWRPFEYSAQFEQLLEIAALTNAIVALAFNPWFKDGESDRTPAIVQDSLVLAIVLGAALPLFEVSSFSFLTGSAIVAAVTGFALQDTLGNAFAGIAIQIERPFRVGHWIGVGDHAGMVTEMTWRATKIRTKAGNLVALPNSQLSSMAVHNYSVPSALTRLQVEVGATYGVAPNVVKDALLAAARASDHVLATPAPEVLLVDFAGSAITYRVRFWIDDFANDERAMSAVRTRIYYELRRRNIEIPWPIQVEYSRQEEPPDVAGRRDRFTHAVARVPVLAGLPEEAHRALASSATELLFADGEIIVRQGDPGASMFLILSGGVVVTLGPEKREVAAIHAGGYFGEMSLITGDPRTATVAARGDCMVLEITSDAFRDYVQRKPEVIDQLCAAATVRRKELDLARAAVGAPPVPAGASLRDRMREFFGLA